MNEAPFLRLLIDGAAREDFDEMVMAAARSGAPEGELRQAMAGRDLALRIRSRLVPEPASGSAALLPARFSALVHAMVAADSLDELWTALATGVRDMLETDCSSVTMRRRQGGSFSVQASDGAVDSRYLDLEFPTGVGIAGAALSSGRAKVCRDYRKDVSFRHLPHLDEATAREGFHAHAVVPIRIGDDLVGTVSAVDRSMRQFTAPEVEWMSRAASLTPLLRSRLIDGPAATGGADPGPRRVGHASDRGRPVGDDPDRRLFVHELHGDDRALDRLQWRAAEVGLDLRRPHVVAGLQADTPARRQGVDELTAACGWLVGDSAVVGHVGDTTVAILQGPDPVAAVRSLRRRLDGRREIENLTVVVDEPGRGIEQLRRSVRDTVRLTGFARGLRAEHEIITSGDLGLLPDVLSPGFAERSQHYVESVLGPVLAQDREGEPHLVTTLRAWFESGQVYAAAAEYLHVHVNTVANRLKKVDELLGARWRTPGRTLDMLMALRLLAVLDTTCGPSTP